jgi:hypothetical protein
MAIAFRILIGAVGLLLVGQQAYHIYGDIIGPYRMGWLFYPFNATIITFGLLALWYALAGPPDLDNIGRALIAGSAAAWGWWRALRMGSCRCCTDKARATCFRSSASSRPGRPVSCWDASGRSRGTR